MLAEVDSENQDLKPVDEKAAWLATLLTDQAEPADSYAGRREEAVWLPNKQVAKAWAEYVRTGATSNMTPPPAPFNVRATQGPVQSVEITWEAEADFESGIRAFIIQRDGSELARVPEKPVGRFGRPLFQQMPYHDTPEQPLPEMRFVDATASAETKHEYRVISLNSAGLRSESSEPSSVPRIWSRPCCTSSKPR